VIIAGCRVIGATLWTDMNLYPGMMKLTRDTVYQSMNDFSKIRTGPSKHFGVEDWIDMHWLDRQYIVETLETPHEGKTLVMTHHIPVRDMIHPLREIGAPARYVSNAGFASDMWWQIRNFDISAWVSGHSHDNRSAVKRSLHGDIRFMANSRGYPQEGAQFDPGYIVEV
jgi:hypothetical protein